jgi:hypothetical protein
MKKLIILSTTLLSLNFWAQDKTVELNCYNKWAAKFEERGAEPVADGIYDDVIITNRQGAKATCNNGKAEVKGGKLIKMWKDKTNENIPVINGISSGMLSVHGEVFNVIWPKKMKAKKAKPSAAPEPTDD